MHLQAGRISEEDEAACRVFIQHHSKSFYLSSLLLPKRVRQASWALYAFCRRADDAVDEAETSDEPGKPHSVDVALRQLDSLHRRLDAAYAGRPDDHAIDRSFANLVETYRIPRALPLALLDGMKMDARPGPILYETDSELLTYCFRVASTVGLMMTTVMGVSEDVAWLRAADLGVAMQLTNIARDVGEDARRGRIYLPRSLLADVGVTPEELLTATAATIGSREATQRILERADGHYRAADLGIPFLPRSCRLAITASRLIYSRIGKAVRKNGYDSITQRAYVSLPGKLGLVLASLPSLLTSVGARNLTSTGPNDVELARLVQQAGLPVPASMKLLSAPAGVAP